jgi:hypothetical protein
MAISTTITQYISNIDIKYPVAGQDNNSQGFRSNFGNIQAALTATYAVVADLDDRVATLDHQLGAITTLNIRADIVTGTNIVQALNQLIIGTTNVVTTGDNYYTVVSMDGAGAGGIKAAGDVALLHNTVATTINYTGPSNTSRYDWIGFSNTKGILNGSTFNIGPNLYTITDTTYLLTANTASTYPNVIETDASDVVNNPVSVTISNPFPAGQYDVQTSIHNLENIVSGISGANGHVSSASSIVNMGGWSIVPNGTSLNFSYDGTIVATLDNLGNFTSVGDIAAGGTL